MTLHRLNQSPAETARKAFLDCCGSQAWAGGMAKSRPYRDFASIKRKADELWWSLTKSGWLEAFAAHPKIGEKRSSAKWASAEQSGMSDANEETAAAMSRMNEEYQHKFGWIFIVSAAGKSAEEMRHALETRLRNTPESELPIAAAEQLKITNLRLAKTDGRMSGISTHVLDTSAGKPAAGIRVRLFQSSQEIASQLTDKDGRCPSLLPPDIALSPGVYRLLFELGSYFPNSFFPEVTILFRIDDTAARYHVPLLISPFGYSTYRGS